MTDEDITAIHAENERLATQRKSLAALDAYRSQLARCHTVEALVEVLMARANDVNKAIAENIRRDQAAVDAYEATCRAQIT